MTKWINTGALVANLRPATKTALKNAIKANPDIVTFDATALGDAGSVTPNHIPQGVKLSVVGPCPYTSRKWYATVENVNGVIRVS